MSSGGARPRWSAAGFAARVARSRYSLFVIVEGRRLDPVFYDRLIMADDELGGVGHIVRSIDTIDMPAGYKNSGKQGVLDLFRFLRKAGKLRQQNRGGSKSTVFIVDRDLDDLTTRQVRSNHVIYTAQRDVEAELYAHGDLVSAIATTMSATHREATRLLRPLMNPLESLALRWREWVELGALSDALRSRCSVRSGSASSVHSPVSGRLDLAAYAKAQSEVVLGADPRYNANYWQQRVSARFRRIYAEGRAGEYVKGKWLGSFLESELKSRAGSSFDYSAFSSVLTHSLLDSLNFSDPWAQEYCDRIRLAC